MPTKFPEIFAALTGPFWQQEVKSRKGADGKMFNYVTARVIQNRLDEVLGPEGWDFEVKPWGENALIGTLILRLPDDTTVRKSDVGGKAEMKAHDDDTKSAASDCLKRCAVQFGIGRYLYKEGVTSYVPGESRQPTPAAPVDKRTKAQRLYDWAMKEGHYQRAEAIANSVYNNAIAGLTDDEAEAVYKLIKNSKAIANVPQPQTREQAPPPPAVQPGPHSPGHNGNGNPMNFGWPTSGAALFAWCKNLEKNFDNRHLIGHMKEKYSETFGDTFKVWTPAQVHEAALFVAGLVRELPGYAGQFDDKLPVKWDLHELQDEIWMVASQLCEALSVSPTTEAIEEQIMNSSALTSGNHGGEVVTDLKACDNIPLLEELLETLRSDLKDSKAAY